MAKPFSSNGELLAVTLNHSRNEIFATVCRNPNDKGATALLEHHNGDVRKVSWDDITFVRSLKLDEWSVGF